MIKCSLFILLLINCQYLFSQENNIELNNFLINLEQINNTDKKINFINRVLIKSKNNEVLFQANYKLGRVYYKKKSNFKLAKKHLFQAEKLSKNIKNYQKTVEVYLSLGFTNYHFNKSDSALYYYNQALIISQKENDAFLISRIYSNIARLYNNENNVKDAINYFHKSINFGKKVKRNLCTTFNNLGALYKDKNIDLDSAIYYYKKSLRFAEKLNIKKHKLRAYINLGIAYTETPKYYDEAYLNLQKAEKLAIELKKERLLYYTQFYLGKYYDLTNKYNQALIYYNKALNSPIAKKDGLQQIEVLQQLSIFHEKQGNYKKANNFQKQYHHLKDSIYSVEKSKAFNDIKTKYEVEKKDNKITLLTKENQLKELRKRNIIIGASAILALLLFITLYLKNRIKTQKIVQKKEHDLFTQELKIKEALSHIEGQENERHRLAKELHDGLGGQLAGIKSIVQTINNTNLNEKISFADKQLSNSIKSLRNISHDLSANFLKDKNFTILVQQLVNQTFENKNLKTEISIFPPKKINTLSERYKLNIYRILQESFQNILKHAQADFVSVNLIIDEEITILIEDNGVGFDTKNKPNGIGLQNIKDRLQSLNGSIQIDSKLNKGTTLNINIPLND